MNNWHRTSAKEWIPDEKSHYVDCNYTITNIRAYDGGTPLFTYRNDSMALTQLTYTFEVIQSCYSNISFIGGSTFEVFSHFEDGLTGCVVFDRLDDSYLIRCDFHHFSPNVSLKDQSKRGRAPPCVQITMILSHEHFDDVGMALLDWNDRYPSR